MPTILETIAVLFTMLSVVLTIKKDVWLWPTGIVGIVAFFFLFQQAHLYSDMTLQVVFLAQSVYGWWFWKHPKKYLVEVPVSTLDDREKAFVGLVCLGSILAVGFVLKRFTDDPAPFLDASIGVLSVAAQWLLMRKTFENWHLWILVNLVSVFVYTTKGLYLTAAEYAVFLVLALVGLVKWKNELPFKVTHSKEYPFPMPEYSYLEDRNSPAFNLGTHYYLENYSKKVLTQPIECDGEMVMIYKDGKLTEEGRKLLYTQPDFGRRGPQK